MFLAYVENFCFLAGESQLSTWKRLSERIGTDRSGSEGSELIGGIGEIGGIGVDRRDRSESELSEWIGADRSGSEWIGTLTSNL